MKVKLLTERVRKSARRSGVHLRVPRNPRSHLILAVLLES